jgi:4-diphosphocytidyl-2-C-methyl-D-erythritol kinase
MTGRGEVLEFLTPRTDITVVLVYPGFSISTPEAYRWFDMEKGDSGLQSIGAEDLKMRYEQQPPERWGFFNSFESVVEKHHPSILRIVGQLVDLGAVFAGVSGSGSTVFALYTEEGAAEHACSHLRGSYPDVWVLVPWALVPLQSQGPAD